MLTKIALDRIKLREKPYKLYDERGLYLLVNPNGRHWWRFKYRFDGLEKTLALGVYPDVRLASGRKKRDDARRLIAEEGIDARSPQRHPNVGKTWFPAIQDSVSFRISGSLMLL